MFVILIWCKWNAEETDKMQWIWDLWTQDSFNHPKFDTGRISLKHLPFSLTIHKNNANNYPKHPRISKVFKSVIQNISEKLSKISKYPKLSWSISINVIWQVYENITKKFWLLQHFSPQVLHMPQLWQERLSHNFKAEKPCRLFWSGPFRSLNRQPQLWKVKRESVIFQVYFFKCIFSRLFFQVYFSEVYCWNQVSQLGLLCQLQLQKVKRVGQIKHIKEKKVIQI